MRHGKPESLVQCCYMVLTKGKETYHGRNGPTRSDSSYMNTNAGTSYSVICLCFVMIPKVLVSKYLLYTGWPKRRSNEFGLS